MMKYQNEGAESAVENLRLFGELKLIYNGIFFMKRNENKHFIVPRDIPQILLPSNIFVQFSRYDHDSKYKKH